VADILISFDTGADGKAADLVVHQGGMNIVAKRLDDESKKPTGP
jgi:hypothetical protein